MNKEEMIDQIALQVNGEILRKFEHQVPMDWTLSFSEMIIDRLIEKGMKLPSEADVWKDAKFSYQENALDREQKIIARMSKDFDQFNERLSDYDNLCRFIAKAVRRGNILLQDEKQKP
jgi:hypothetical protein